MQIVSAIVVFSLCWWALFFMALPIGVSVPERQENDGHAQSAPVKTDLRKKAFWVTVISVIFTLAWVGNSVAGWIDLRHLLHLDGQP